MAYSKEEAKSGIGKLVEDFKRNKSRLQNQAEAQIENNFIRPLFKYLNWNTVNEGLAVADYEFVVNRTGRGGKRPDYTLQLDGQHLLVMDAKQVKYDMHDPRWLNQVYAYGYSTQNLAPTRRIDFAVLSDFEEFVVLDCTLHVNEPKALRNFLVLNWTCDDYVDRFDQLWDLFERENMRRTARTRHGDAPRGLWALALSPRKVKANRIPPDKAFLADMDNDQNGWRVRLAKDMKKHNPAADGTLITAAVQLLIDRLIFIKALSDREIEDDYLAQLAETVEKDGLDDSDIGWFAACRKIFEKLNRFYNGSIFKPRPELEAVTVANKTVSDIIRSLQPENSPYNFAVLPVEILGTIYERFLGRVVRTTEQRVKIEEKPEVRKAGGVYYTPQYIVEYIVKNTVGKLLENCKTPADVAKLKILDPACGSGSFLVGAYAFLIDWHIKYFDTKKRLSAADRADAYYDSDGRVRLTARLKREILTNNLFGVDIDQQAVEVTRFSLSLKALEDTRREELYEERSLFKETVLPDLNNNIKCGNSLIGPDYFSGKMFPDSEELRRVNPFDWQREFPTIFSSGSFDAVIGNPPYGAQFSDEIKKYFRTNYVSSQGRYESYWYFIEKGLVLTGMDGRFCLIVPDTWFTLRDAESLRRLILSDANIEKLLVLNENVFEKVKVDVCIFVASKISKRELTTVFIASKDHTSEDFVAERFIKEFKVDQSKWLSTDESRIIVNQSQDDVNLISKISINSIFLSEISIATTGPKPYQIGKGVPPQTKQIIETKPFTSDHKKNKTFRIMLRGSDIARYSYSLKSDEWLSYGEWLAEIRDPTIFDRPRLLVQSIRNPKLKRRIIATYTKDDFINNNSITNIVMRENAPYDIFYLLGILNSNLINWLFVKSFSIVNIDPRYLKMVPIRRIDCSNPNEKSLHNKMVVLVESILLLHKHMAEAKTQTEQVMIQRQIDATDRDIDAQVYKLYDLTKEEIEIVEGEAKNA